MKLKINIIIFSLILTLFSCDYLDVDQKGIVSEDEMFQDVDGFESSMYGVYASMAKTSLYGKVLTYGFMEEICYSFENPISLLLKKEINHEYNDVSLKSLIDNIWYGEYKTLSYINNIIKNVENGVLKGSNRYDMIKGEALGLRAYIHFDILRLFCKNCIPENFEAQGIPYQTNFGLDVPETSTIKGTLDLIILDLNNAKELLKDYYDLSDGSYSSEQSLHFNLFAVKATLAKVYLYMGEDEKAAKESKDVIDAIVTTSLENDATSASDEEIKNRFSLMDKSLINAEHSYYPNGGEAIFGLYKKDIYEDIYMSFINNAGVGESVNAIRYVAVNVDKLYEKSTFTDVNNDYRLKAYFTEDNKNHIFLKRYGEEVYNSASKVAKWTQGISLIQLPELYYIYAEAEYNLNKTECLKYLNIFLASRGLKNITEEKINTKEKLQDYLYKDKKKEFFGMGKLFLESKRLNKNLIDYDENEVLNSSQFYTFTWPDLEKEYGTSK